MENILPTLKNFILTNFLPGEDPAQLTPSTELVRTGILESLGTLRLVSFLESEYGIRLEAHDISPTNLATLSDIESMIRRKLGIA